MLHTTLSHVEREGKNLKKNNSIIYRKTKTTQLNRIQITDAAYIRTSQIQSTTLFIPKQPLPVLESSYTSQFVGSPSCDATTIWEAINRSHTSPRI